MTNAEIGLMSWREHEIEVSRLKRKIELLRGEIECYRAAYPGWSYSHDSRRLYCTGDEYPLDFSDGGSVLD